MVEQIFTTVGTAITQFATVFGNAMQNICSLFVTTPQSGTPTLTTLGVLCVIPMGIGIVYGAWSLLRNLISLH